MGAWFWKLCVLYDMYILCTYYIFANLVLLQCFGWVHTVLSLTNFTLKSFTEIGFLQCVPYVQGIFNYIKTHPCICITICKHKPESNFLQLVSCINLDFIVESLQAKSWTITLQSPRKYSTEAPRDARTSLQQATKIYRA